MVTLIVHGKRTPTSEQIEMLEAMEKRPIVFDEDCPEYSREELAAMRQKAKEKRAEKNGKTTA